MLASLADLDSQGGRYVSLKSLIHFVVSVAYLFRTTYQSSDDMSVSALPTYLNVALLTCLNRTFALVHVRGLSKVCGSHRFFLSHTHAFTARRRNRGSHLLSPCPPCPHPHLPYAGEHRFAPSRVDLSRRGRRVGLHSRPCPTAFFARQ